MSSKYFYIYIQTLMQIKINFPKYLENNKILFYELDMNEKIFQ